MKNENTRLYVNRAVSFLIGGLLTFAVMSFTVVSTADKQIEELTKTLDVSRYEAGRLLADAKEQFANKDFAKAKTSLTTLFDRQPGSKETLEGKTLLPIVETAEKAAGAKWTAAMAGVQKKWSDDMAADLRMKSDKVRADLEKGMNEAITQEWEKAKAKVREDWEKKQG